MEEDVSRYYTLLRDPSRRRIVEILGEQGKAGFKELKETLGLGVGTVYYHLDMLSDFIKQDKHRKYMLNDHGRLLYQSLRREFCRPRSKSRRRSHIVLGAGFSYLRCSLKPFNPLSFSPSPSSF